MYSFKTNKLLRLWIFLAIHLIIQQRSAAQEHQEPIVGIWSGTMTMHISSSSITGTHEVNISLSIFENNVTGTVEIHDKAIIEGKHLSSMDCSGSGKGQLEKVQFEPTNRYSILAFSPGIHCITTSMIGGPTEESDGTAPDVAVSSEPTPTNRNRLNGTRTERSKLADIGEQTITTTWDLSRSSDIVLIVTPIDYDKWLPAPGMDELTKGSVMKVNLKLSSISGRPLGMKATSFELNLINTSIEPGITINYPVSPRAIQLPDLRLLKADIAESIGPDQYLTIDCKDGTTGKVSIASYDGGGWSTLSAVAIMEDGARIRGHLLTAQGEVDIRIPKRDIGSKIATSWLNANNNPGEMDDKDESDGNKNNGDGLTAYEEYRGVIHQGVFKRFDPQKKELGFLIRQSEMSLFNEGRARFENATGIKTYVFGKNEIPDNRRLNQNGRSAHDFNQCVIRLGKGNTGITSVYKDSPIAWGVCFPTNTIPAKVTHVTIDVDRINRWYQATLQSSGNDPASLPFTANDLIASTTAHEIGHAVSLPHHGNDLKPLPGTTVDGNPPRIFLNDRVSIWESEMRPYPVTAPIGLPGNNESGNVSCFMCYRSKSRWVKVADNVVSYYQVPLMAAGSMFCIEKKGTGINAGGKYFGNAINGECLKNIKLR